MDTPASPPVEHTLLAEEIRHSAVIIGAALGLMGLVAMTLLFLTTRYGG